MSSFTQIISDLRKGCGTEITPGEVYETLDGTKFKLANIICGKEYDGDAIYCPICQAKLDQTLLCEKIANEKDPLDEIIMDENESKWFHKGEDSARIKAKRELLNLIKAELESEDKT
jgi:hypothetical protein